MQIHAGRNYRKQKIGRINALVFLLCLAFALGMPQLAGASDQQQLADKNGWSLVPDAKTSGTSKTPDYIVRPTAINPLRIQSNKAPAPVRLHTNSEQPLFFELHNQQLELNTGLRSQEQLDLTSILGWQPLDQLVVALGLHTSIFDQAQNSTDFQPISSIQCESASMESGLYHASNCYFTNNDQARTQPVNNISSIGATWGASESASLQVEYFRQNTAALNPGLPANIALPGLLTSGHNPLSENRALLPTAQLGGNTRLDGFGINLALGYEHDQMGKLRLGLQLSRINNLEITNSFGNLGQPMLPVSSVSPFHTATVNIDWNRGSFSGGVQGYYREPLSLYHYDASDELTGFDIYFSWRAPWNANLSIGTSSVIEPGISSNIADEGSSDPFERVYGRVPYVRYEQDL